jgi:hypothetical protein
MIPPKSVATKVRCVAVDFLAAMRDAKFDFVWDTMITQEAAYLMSTALLPVRMYQEGKIDVLLRSMSVDRFTMSADEAFAFAFQRDWDGTRSGLFQGMANSFREMGWFDVVAEDCEVFVGDTGGVLLEVLNRRSPLFVFFVRDVAGDYWVDFEAILFFSNPTMASSLHQIAMRAQQIGQLNRAIAYYELAASIAHPYERIRKLMRENPIVEQVITETRRAEMSEEEESILLARHQALLMLSGPKNVGRSTFNMARFLASAFNGYSEIGNMALDEREIAQLLALDDADLRSALARMLNAVNPIVAQREAIKPHGAHEIADIEILVEHEGSQFRLSIPIKSGLEVKTQVVPVRIAYQIIRPFLTFPDGIVVFVTARPCSQHLLNYLKAANDILGLTIEVIQYQELGKLLKINGLLTN